MTVSRSLGPVGLLVFLLVGCGRPSGQGLASVEPLAISQRSTSPLEIPPGVAPADAAGVQPNGPSASAMPSSAVSDAVIKQLIERANTAQAEAFTRKDPGPMREAATDAYYAELARINADMARDGVTAIKLLRIEWGAITITGDTAKVTTYETWRTDYDDGTGDEGRDRNDYTLIRANGAWKIDSDVHPEDVATDVPGASGSAQPAAAPSPFAEPANGGRSHNWSGYSASGGTFSVVEATWTIPRPTASALAADATWVGIGGVRTRDLIQAGTEQTVSPSGRVSYEAWIETLPQVSRAVQLKISPGDSVSVSIAEQQQDSWQVSFTNHTTGQTFQATQPYKSSQSSAEWVEEAPSGRRGVMNLSNFGSIAVSGASAVKDGKSVSIRDAGGRAITMIDRNDRPIAQPSQLGEDGASFTVVRVNVPAASRSSAPVGARSGA